MMIGITLLSFCQKKTTIEPPSKSEKNLPNENIRRKKNIWVAENINELIIKLEGRCILSIQPELSNEFFFFQQNRKTEIVYEF